MKDDFLAKQVESFVRDLESEVSRIEHGIYSKRDMIRMMTGARVRVPDLRAAEELRTFLHETRLKAPRMSARERTEKLAELKRRGFPVLEFLRGVRDGLEELKESVKPESFSENPKPAASVKNYPVEPEEKGDQKKMSKTKVFQDGRWQYLDTSGEELAARAKQVQKENPTLDFGECLILAEKLLREAEEAGGEKHFSEGGTAQEFAERFPGVPPEAVRKLADARRGVAITLSDGSQWMRVYMNGGDRILPVSNEEAEEMLAFQDSKNFEGRDPAKGHFIKPKKEPVKPGFSEDKKSFTDFRTGRISPVLTDKDEEQEAECMAFVKRFDLEFASVDLRDLERAAKRAIQVLRSGGIKPFEAEPREAELAIRAGASDETHFDAALRYTATGVFGTFEKAVVAALA